MTPVSLSGFAVKMSRWMVFWNRRKKAQKSQKNIQTNPNTPWPLYARSRYLLYPLVNLSGTFSIISRLKVFAYSALFCGYYSEVPFRLCRKNEQVDGFLELPQKGAKVAKKYPN